jgi:hypothetical protein
MPGGSDSAACAAMSGAERGGWIEGTSRSPGGCSGLCARGPCRMSVGAAGVMVEGRICTARICVLASATGRCRGISLAMGGSATGCVCAAAGAAGAAGVALGACGRCRGISPAISEAATGSDCAGGAAGVAIGACGCCRGISPAISGAAMGSDCAGGAAGVAIGACSAGLTVVCSKVGTSTRASSRLRAGPKIGLTMGWIFPAGLAAAVARRWR